MPRLWNETIEAHRREVRDAILDTTAALVAERGLASVTMSQIATDTGIGRATLYKYFSDVESILVAWHERQIEAHLDRLTEVRGGAGSPGDRLRAILEAYAELSRADDGNELAALLHQGPHVARARHRLHSFVQVLIAEAVTSGEIRDDVPPGELASYCIHALAAAGGMPSKAAVQRLVTVTLVGLRPDPDQAGSSALKSQTT
jgi:AcrR family transcriptional regulator